MKSINRRRAQKKARYFGGQHNEPAQDDEIAQLRTKIVELELRRDLQQSRQRFFLVGLHFSAVPVYFQ